MESIAVAGGYDCFVASICKQCHKMHIIIFSNNNMQLHYILRSISFHAGSYFLNVHSATRILTLAMQTAFLKIFLQHYLLFCASVWPGLEHIRFFARQSSVNTNFNVELAGFVVQNVFHLENLQASSCCTCAHEAMSSEAKDNNC